MAWLTGYSYRKKITITGQTGAGTDYQVKLLVGESSGATGEQFDVEGHSEEFPTKSASAVDSGDLRFTDNDGETLLPFWVESITGSTPNALATIWVKVADSLESGTVDIYCYYGKTSPTNVASGANTFLFFDDFDDNSIDATKWVKRIESGTITEQNSRMECAGGSTSSPYGHTCMESSGSTGFSFRTGILEGKVYLSANAIAEVGFRGGTDPANTGYKNRMDTRANNGVSHLKPPYASWGFVGTQGTTPVTTSTWLLFRITVYDNGTTCTMKTEVDGQTKTSTDTDYATASGFLSLQNHYGISAFYDDIRVRKYVATEPAFSSADSEENASSSSSSSSLSSSSSSSSLSSSSSSSSSSSFSSSSSSSFSSSSSSNSFSSSSSSSSFSSSSSSSSFSSSSSSSSSSLSSSSSSSSSFSSSSSSSSSSFSSSSSSSFSSSSSSSSLSSSSSSSSLSSSSSSSSLSSSSSSSSFSSSSSSSSFSSSSSSSSFSSSSSSSSFSSGSFSSSSSSCSQDATKDYSKGDESDLPVDDTNLETNFICTDYPKVDSDNDIYVQQCATNEYTIFLFKKQAASSNKVIILKWIGKSSLAPSSYEVFLQIYNYDSTTWENLDSNNVTAIDTEFTLNGVQSTSLSDYYDGSNWIAYRIYQKAE